MLFEHHAMLVGEGMVCLEELRAVPAFAKRDGAQAFTAITNELICNKAFWGIASPTERAFTVTM